MFSFWHISGFISLDAELEQHEFDVVYLINGLCASLLFVEQILRVCDGS